MERPVETIRELIYLLLPRVEARKLEDKSYADILNSYSDVVANRVLKDMGDMLDEIIGENVVSDHKDPPPACQCASCTLAEEINRHKDNARLRAKQSLALSNMEVEE